MPPRVILDENDILAFHADVENYMNCHKGLISKPVLVDKLHRIEYYYGEQIASECLSFYEFSGQMVEDKYGIKRYQLWRRKL